MHDHLPLEIACHIIARSGSWIIMDGRTCTPADVCAEWCRMWRSSAEAVVESYRCLRPMSRARALARIARGRPYWSEATTKEILRRCVDGLDDDGLLDDVGLLDAAFLESSKDGNVSTTSMRLLIDTFPERIDKVQKRTLEASLLNVIRNTISSDAELAEAVRLLLGWPVPEHAPRANEPFAFFSAAVCGHTETVRTMLEWPEHAPRADCEDCDVVFTVIEGLLYETGGLLHSNRRSVARILLTHQTSPSISRMIKKILDSSFWSTTKRRNAIIATIKIIHENAERVDRFVDDMLLIINPGEDISTAQIQDLIDYFLTK